MKFLVNEDIKPDYYMFKLDSNHKVLESALDLVREYIIDNDLLIVGGMAIDFSLKLKGSGIYSMYEIPDYDVVSYDNVKHANEVGQALCKLGVQEVAVIPAVHKTTMRVQIAGYTVFDATYLPLEIYKNIPTLEYEPFIIVHPMYQMIDQLLSLSLLWQITGPDFNIFNRLKKDTERYQLLSTHYSVPKIDYIQKETFKKVAPSAQVITGGPAENFDINFVWHGQIAYGFYVELYKKLTKSDVFSLEKYSYQSTYEVLVQKAPSEYDKFIKGYSSVSPDCYITGDRMNYVLTNFTVNVIDGIYIVSPYYLASYCLYKSFHSDNTLWNSMFHGIKKMMSCDDIKNLSLKSVGIEFWKDENYDFFIRNYESMIKEKKSLDGVPPKNYLQVPDCIVKKTFDPSLSEFYSLHDG